MMSGLRAVEEWNLIFSHTSTTVLRCWNRKGKKLHSSWLLTLHFKFLENEREFHCQWRRRSHYIVQVGATRKIWRIQQVKMWHFFCHFDVHPPSEFSPGIVSECGVLYEFEWKNFPLFWIVIIKCEQEFCILSIQKFSKKIHVEISDLVWNQREHED